MFLGEPVVPAAVPNGEIVGVLLIGVGKLGACEGLDVNVAVSVGIGFQLNLGRCRRGSSDQKYCGG
jgi:hypothetical protein